MNYERDERNFFFLHSQKSEDEKRKKKIEKNFHDTCKHRGVCDERILNILKLINRKKKQKTIFVP